MNWNSLTPKMSKDNCVLFKLMALLYLFSAILMFFSMVLSKEKIHWLRIVTIVTPLIGYYILLVLYSMCIRTLS